jgi:hypothetical protein
VNADSDRFFEIGEGMSCGRRGFFVFDELMGYKSMMVVIVFYKEWSILPE